MIQLLNKFKQKVYPTPGFPIGTIYINIDNIDPSKFFGGTWERFSQGRMLAGVDENDTAFSISGKTGGEKEHILTVEELAEHHHTTTQAVYNATTGFLGRDGLAGNGAGYKTGSTGGGKAHNNMPPYITVYMWKKVA